MNFTDLLERHHIPFRQAGEHHHAHQGWIQLDCPICAPNSGKFHLGYNLSGGYFNCWIGGRHPTYDILQKLFGQTTNIRELVQSIQRFQFKSLPKPSGRLQEPLGIGKLGLSHKRYLERRGFDPDALEQQWEVQGIGISSRLQWRLYIPVHLHDRVVSWTTRAITDETDARYVSAKPHEESMPLKSLLYGEDAVRNAIIVCEGPTDVWRIGPGAVATFGTSYTQAQVERISKYPVRAICFDNEPKAQEQARQLADDLSVFPGETYNVVLDSKDAGSAGYQEILDLRHGILGD